MVLRLHGYGAWIESDGKPLEEYSVEVKDNIISCYVCSEEGKVRTDSPEFPVRSEIPSDWMYSQGIRSTLRRRWHPLFRKLRFIP